MCKYAIALVSLVLFIAPAFAEPQAPSIAPSELANRQASGTAPVVIVEAPRGVALYCMVGPRARRGEAALFQAGYTSVFHLEGGLAAWQAAGLPVEGAP